MVPAPLIFCFRKFAEKAPAKFVGKHILENDNTKKLENDTKKKLENDTKKKFESEITDEESSEKKKRKKIR